MPATRCPTCDYSVGHNPSCRLGGNAGRGEDVDADRYARALLTELRDDIRAVKLVVAWWFALTLLGAVIWAVAINRALGDLGERGF